MITSVGKIGLGVGRLSASTVISRPSSINAEIFRYLLLENGSLVLLESGSGIKLETSVPVVPSILLENGIPII